MQLTIYKQREYHIYTGRPDLENLKYDNLIHKFNDVCMLQCMCTIGNYRVTFYI